MGQSKDRPRHIPYIDAYFSFSRYSLLWMRAISPPPSVCLAGTQVLTPLFVSLLPFSKCRGSLLFGSGQQLCLRWEGPEDAFICRDCAARIPFEPQANPATSIGRARKQGFEACSEKVEAREKVVVVSMAPRSSFEMSCFDESLFKRRECVLLISPSVTNNSFW